MIIDHTNPLYVKKRKSLTNGNQYNGAYYYSKEIVKNIIPNVKTDRNWITIRLPEMTDHPDHSIVFIHNNRNPNYYAYLRDYKDCVLVCSLESTAYNMRFFSDKVIYLPLSVDVEQVKKYRVKEKTKEVSFAGRLVKISPMYHAPVPKDCDILTGMPQAKLLREMSKYKKIYATGRTAIQAKILGCEVLAHDPNFMDTRVWQVLDNKEAAKILQHKLNLIDGGF
ncbi:MAG: hypothetical protein J6S85_18375 [Methanobrevibacter sp.]|nr:hypothetical protein [Methanobrevibacter sp.]